MKHIYVFRQPEPFVRSWQKLEIHHKWDEVKGESLIRSCGFPHLNGFPMFDVEFMKKRSHFGKIALFAISYNAAFESLIKKGYPIPSVKFDDFIKDPRKVILKVFEHFQLPFDLLPDINKVLNTDSQGGTVLSSRSADQNELNKRLAPITDAVKEEVDMMCREYNVPLFWDGEFYLSNNIDTYVNL